jgi:hypothetical protein
MVFEKVNMIFCSSVMIPEITPVIVTRADPANADVSIRMGID